MKTEAWGNGGAVEIQGLTASKSLPQLTQDVVLLGGQYADTPRKQMPDLQMSAVVFQVGVEGGWRGRMEA